MPEASQISELLEREGRPLYPDISPKGEPLDLLLKKDHLLFVRPSSSSENRRELLSMGRSVFLGLVLLSRLPDLSKIDKKHAIALLKTPLSRRRFLAFAGLIAALTKVGETQQALSQQQKPHKTYLAIAGDPRSGPEPRGSTPTATPTMEVTETPSPSSTPTPSPTETPTPNPSNIEVRRSEYPHLTILSEHIVDHSMPYNHEQIPMCKVGVPNTGDYCVDIGFDLTIDHARANPLKVPGGAGPNARVISTPYGRISISLVSKLNDEGEEVFACDVGNITHGLEEAVKNQWTRVQDYCNVNRVETTTRLNAQTNEAEVILLFRGVLMPDGSKVDREVTLPLRLENHDPMYQPDRDSIMISAVYGSYSQEHNSIGVRFRPSEGVGFNDTTIRPGTEALLKRGKIVAIGGWGILAQLNIGRPPDTWDEYFANLKFTNSMRQAATLWDLRFLTSSKDRSWQEWEDRLPHITFPVRTRLQLALEAAKRFSKQIITHAGNFDQTAPIYGDLSDPTLKQEAQDQFYHNIRTGIGLLDQHGPRVYVQPDTPGEEPVPIPNAFMVMDYQDGVVSGQDTVFAGRELPYGVVVEGIEFAKTIETAHPIQYGFRTDGMFGFNDSQRRLDQRNALFTDTLQSCLDAGLNDLCVDIGGIVSARSITQDISGVSNSISSAIQKALRVEPEYQVSEDGKPFIGRIHLDINIDFAGSELSKEEKLAQIILEVEKLIGRYNINIPVTFGLRWPDHIRLLNSDATQSNLTTPSS